MSSNLSQPPVSFVRPRPGVVKALGIANLLVSLFTTVGLITSVAWVALAISRPKSTVTSTVVIGSSPSPTVPPRQRTMVAFDPFVGMDDPRLVRFSIVDTSTGLLLSVLMFATGVGLINLRRWSARWWTFLAWVKIVRVWLFWGFFVVAVAPSVAETMAHAALTIIPNARPNSQGMSPLEILTRVYSIMWLIVGAIVIFFGTLYPAISLWILSRPGVKAALIDKNSAPEPQLP